MSTGKARLHLVVPNHTPTFEEKGSTELQSWKEIAAYLKVSLRTVQSWEKELQLPIWRSNRQQRSRVMAYTEEIDRWVASRLASKTLTPAARSLTLVQGPVCPKKVSEQKSLIHYSMSWLCLIGFQCLRLFPWSSK